MLPAELTISHGSSSVRVRRGPTVGHGCSSVVIRATEIEGNHRDLVIKIIRDRHECLECELRAYRMLRRARMTGRGVPKLIASGPVIEDSHAPALVFEDNPRMITLHRHLRNVRRMTEGQVQVFARRLLRIVGRLHRRCRTLHGDIKTDNILLDPRTLKVQLIDFGISEKLHRVRGRPAERMVSHEVYTGVFTNSPPENLLRSTRTLGVEYDTWKIGCVLFECLTGQGPFDDIPAGPPGVEIPRFMKLDDPTQIPLAERILGGSFESPMPLSVHAMRFLRRCLTVSPDDRPLPADLLRDSWLREPESEAEEDDDDFPE